LSRKRDKNEVEHYKGIIRQLKSENRNLKKRLKQTDRYNRLDEELREDYADLLEEKHYKEDRVVDLINCPDCKRDTKLVDLGRKKYVVCNHCSFRKVIYDQEKEGG
jgi:DNA-directed RNA polymerase subunit RPC12/RpoP